VASAAMRQPRIPEMKRVRRSMGLDVEAGEQPRATGLGQPRRFELEELHRGWPMAPWASHRRWLSREPRSQPDAHPQPRRQLQSGGPGPRLAGAASAAPGPLWMASEAAPEAAKPVACHPRAPAQAGASERQVESWAPGRSGAASRGSRAWIQGAKKGSARPWPVLGPKGCRGPLVEAPARTDAGWRRRAPKR
jgi:hypothetical protein